MLFVLCCYHWTKERLQGVNPNCELVFNFPIVETSGIKPPKVVNVLKPTTRGYRVYCQPSGRSKGNGKEWSADGLGEI